MQKLSVKKLSILGIVLTAASAVTAAVMPSKSSDIKFANSADNGTLVDNSGGGGSAGIVSCITDVNGGVSCHLTAASSTGALSEVAGRKTAGNTSDSIPNNAADTTSVVS